MMQLEHIGSLYIETQRLLSEYRSLLGLVARVASGDVLPSQIKVDEANVSWSLVLGSAEPEKPSESAT
jgi:hypothetical protein